MKNENHVVIGTLGNGMTFRTAGILNPMVQISEIGSGMGRLEKKMLLKQQEQGNKIIIIDPRD